MDECKYCNWWKPDTHDGKLCVKCGRKYRGLARVGEIWRDGSVKIHFERELPAPCTCGSRNHFVLVSNVGNWYCPKLVAAYCKLVPIEEPNNLYFGDPSPVHIWFELTYASYLTIPRCVLEAMPVEWQARFAECLEELDSKIDWRPESGRYWVQLKDSKGRYVSDPLNEYRHRVPNTIPWRKP